MKETIDWPIFAMKLQQMRIAAEMTQKDLADTSLVGVKTISAFESGARTNAISFAQLVDLTWACGYTVTEFLATAPEAFIRKAMTPPRKNVSEKRTFRLGYHKKYKPRRVPQPQIAPDRGITIFRSSDHLQSSLGEARR